MPDANAASAAVFAQPRERWQAHLRDETAAWARWFELARAGTDKEVMSDYLWRIGPRADVRDREIYAPFLRPLCPPGSEARILDVGAGPLTYFPRQWFTRNYSITPVDPLADEFDRMLAAYPLEPHFHTIKGEAETLLEQFGPESYHCVFTRNALEQFRDPFEAIRQMLAVVKPGGWVLLQQEGYRTPEEQPRCPWQMEENADDVFLNAPGGGRLDLGMEFADIATLRVIRSWHWPWILAGFKKEPL
jgi:SAM-dependent methyltransferase